MNEYQPQNNPVPPYQKKKTPSKRKKLIIGIVVGYVVLDAIVLGAVGVLNKDKLITEETSDAVASETALEDSLIAYGNNLLDDLSETNPVEVETTAPATTTTTKPSTTAPTSTTTTTKRPTTTTKPTTTTTTSAPSSTKSSAGGGGGGWEGHTTSVKNTASLYVLNKDSLKVHTPNCYKVDEIAPENYAETNNLDEAKSKGYTPCGLCHPF